MELKIAYFVQKERSVLVVAHVRIMFAVVALCTAALSCAGEQSRIDRQVVGAWKVSALTIGIDVWMTFRPDGSYYVEVANVENYEVGWDTTQKGFWAISLSEERPQFCMRTEEEIEMECFPASIDSVIDPETEVLQRTASFMSGLANLSYSGESAPRETVIERLSDSLNSVLEEHQHTLDSLAHDVLGRVQELRQDALQARRSLFSRSSLTRMVFDNELDRLNGSFLNRYDRMPLDQTLADSARTLLSMLIESLDQPVTGAAAWDIVRSTDPIDETTSITAIRVADGSSQFNQVKLFIRCRGGVGDVFINWSDYLGSDDPMVEYRLLGIGGDDPRRDNWSISTSGQSTFFPGSSQQFASDLMRASRLVARVTKYNSRTLTAEFNLSGSTEAIAPVARACSW